MLLGYFGALAAVAALDLPASNPITRQALGWYPAEPGFVADWETVATSPTTANELTRGRRAALRTADRMASSRGPFK